MEYMGMDIYILYEQTSYNMGPYLKGSKTSKKYQSSLSHSKFIKMKIQGKSRSKNNKEYKMRYQKTQFFNRYLLNISPEFKTKNKNPKFVTKIHLKVINQSQNRPTNK